MSMDKLTMAEIAHAERIANLSVRMLSVKEAPTAKLMTAIAWLIAKRSDAALKFDDFEKATTFPEVMEMINGTEADDEKKA